MLWKFLMDLQPYYVQTGDHITFLPSALKVNALALLWHLCGSWKPLSFDNALFHWQYLLNIHYTSQTPHSRASSLIHAPVPRNACSKDNVLRTGSPGVLNKMLEALEIPRYENCQSKTHRKYLSQLLHGGFGIIVWCVMWDSFESLQIWIYALGLFNIVLGNNKPHITEN